MVCGERSFESGLDSSDQARLDLGHCASAMFMRQNLEMDMTSKRRERTTHNIASSSDNPYCRASFRWGSRLARLLWQVVYLLFYRTSPPPLHEWRAILLRLFGAEVGANSRFYPSGKVWAPWNLVCEDCCTLGHHAEIYNPSPVYLETHCVISQQAYVCGATHDFNALEFPGTETPKQDNGRRLQVGPNQTIERGQLRVAKSITGQAGIAGRKLRPSRPTPGRNCCIVRPAACAPHGGGSCLPT